MKLAPERVGALRNAFRDLKHGCGNRQEVVGGIGCI